MHRTLLVCLFLLPLAAAQNPDAPHPDENNITLWAHTTSGDEALFMNTLQDDGTAGGAYLHPGTGASSVSAGTSEDFRFDLPLDPGLVADLLLDPDGEITMTAYIGGGAFTVGRVSAQASLVSGETIIGSGGSVTKNLQPGDTNDGSTYNKFEWSFPADVTTIPAGADLTWVIEGSGSWNNLYMSANENRGRSFMTLPITGTEGGPVTVAPVTYQNLSSDIIELDLSWGNESRIDQYNWTAPMGPLAVSLVGNLTGNVTVEAAGASAFLNETLSGAFATTFEVEGDGANWTFRFSATEANGTLRFTVQPPTAGDSMDGDSMDDDQMDGNMTADLGDDADGKDSPGLGLVAVLGAVAVALRRRH